ncbi:aminotransferase class I/II-fold pyridoxal phosphate-dependent enzyme [Aliikangiella coralliicola]|uniref:Aminotransferase class I/II-fold pyridoxal phosphate-dependent enzyme n=1 Tax=Aliikangiella coralliicola TaxID=2592383 RepID=A0A545U7D8_9GAMM|nr:aminotransferase class I/II-fold pyridoxal phosphate-dependent enzyme [Aliikangiella coralliicola]TQV85382.1 aminotransferase class I/II-fold pyridoxal phosphate-dependent enzyme [Aliikangiella coralliicola]
MTNEKVTGFVKQCQQSSNHAYEAFKTLLSQLESKETRLEAYLFFKQLYQFYDSAPPADCHFQFIRQNILDQSDETVSLKLLQFPSTFLPEAWSFTFYEGLIRYPANEYQERNVVELGCGIGWITIALALRYSPQNITGLDINPKAIVCAKLNLFLNAFNDDDQTLKILANGKSLLDCVYFFESNLFSYFNQSKTHPFEDSRLEIDRIIGCIPQVLNPEPEVMEDLIAETASDDYLYSLSNYFAKQGFIEDQFGLGLIASAVEQSIPLLRSTGKLILNLGGRPGRAVLERLMRRRGFKVRRVWQTQVEQAADTEIDMLVDIEKSTGHRFEFYMSPNSDMTIDARTALEYARAGGKIYHSVDVYEAEMLFPDQVKSIFESVDLVGGKALRSAIDLTYENFDDAEERYSFLAFLARHLQRTQHFPYGDTAGLNYFRQQLAEYFCYYLKVNVTEQQLVITPGRSELITSLLTNYRPKLTLVARELIHLIEKGFDEQSTQIIEAPSKVEFLIELVDKLKPQLIITQLDVHEVQSSQLVRQLIECAQQNNVFLLVDLTNNIDLSSQPQINGVYRYLSEHPLPSNLIIMAALINNRVYKNYSLNITLTSNQQLVKDVVDAAELTYSRTPILKQLYYAHLLEELLYFQRTRSTSKQEAAFVSESNTRLSIPLCLPAQNAFNHPAIQGNHLAFDHRTIRLDYGENELPAPTILKEKLFESYLVRRCSVEESNPEEPLRELMEFRFGIPLTFYSEMLFGNGVAPIFSSLLNLCTQEKKSLVIPSGSYGYFMAAAQYKDVDIGCLHTGEENQFKINAESLDEYLSTRVGCWLFLNAPVVNPVGAVYSQAELNDLLSIALKYDVTVILDSVFSGLEFNENSNWNLSDCIYQFVNSKRAKLVFIGGISKEYAAGGLRFGYCWSTSKPLIADLKSLLPHSPHFTLGYTVRKIIEAQLSGESSLQDHLLRQRKELESRAHRLSQLLTQKGWKVIQPSGGLFLVAKPQAFIDKYEIPPIDAADQVTSQLFKLKNLVINNSTWTGLPGYCRFVLSCSDGDFEEAVKRLSEFDFLG